MDFGELPFDGFFDTGALTSAISEADSQKIQLLAPRTILQEGPPPEFQKMVANGHLETPSATVEIQLEVGDILIKEPFIVMTNLTSPLIGLQFPQSISTILDICQEIRNFLFFSVLVKHADNTYSNTNELC